MAPPLDDDSLDRLASRDFLRAAAAQDVRQGRYDGQVVTRFPPEPNGYLHIGHAKAIVMDFGVARDFGGRCHLRMDDTNPTTESVEFARAIEADVRWLGFDWGEHLYFASDMYEAMYDLAVRLIDKGLAYVDEQSLDQIRVGRGTVTEPGTDSPFRDRPVEQSKARFAQMRAGELPDGAAVLRAKIDMAAPNMLLRDPVIYRIKHAHHYRRGDDWCVFPMYDFAHCLEDALEGVTHSFCTLEFQDNRALYDWFIEQTEVVPPDRAPQQYEVARLEMDYVITSKRKLKQLVEEGHVAGWDDPRMPTLAGLRRRGVPPEAIVAFVEDLGIAKTNSRVEYARLEHFVRDHLNHVAPRRMGVVDPLELVIDTWPEDHVEEIEAAEFPSDVLDAGGGSDTTRTLRFGKRLYIERADFALEPLKGFKRLSPGMAVRLRNGHVVRCTDYECDAGGRVIRLRAEHFPGTPRGAVPEDVKVKGTIHWVHADTAVPCELRLYGHLFTVPAPLADPAGRDFLELLDPDSLVVQQGFVEGSVAGAAVGTRFQLERTGYFVVDPDSTAEGLVLARTITLKDSWARKKPTVRIPEPAPPPAVDDDKRRRKRRSPAELRAEAREADPTLQAAFDRYRDLGLDEDDADVLSGDTATVALLDGALAAGSDTQAVANFVLHELRGMVEDVAELPFDGRPVGVLATELAEGRVSPRGARRVLELMLSEGGEPLALIEREGLAMDAGEDELATAIDGLLATHPDELARFRAGEAKLFGFFMGQLMRAMGGKADPRLARSLLNDKLRG